MECDEENGCCSKSNRDRVCGKSERPFAASDANNNQLKYLALILEEIYRNPRYPAGVRELPTSLFDDGISRADLWAFAGLVGLKYSAFLNNDACNRTKGAHGDNAKLKCHYHIRQGKRGVNTTFIAGR